MTELLELATTVAGWALPGEDVEVFASRSRTLEIDAYGGEIESLTSAEPAGVGIRVIAGGRQGFASAGTLDETVLKETLEDARDNAGFSVADAWIGLPSPDGVAPAQLDIWRESLASVPTSAKTELALELERLVRGRDPRVTGVRTASYGDALVEQAVASTKGIATFQRRCQSYVAVSALAEADGDTQIATGFSLGRHPDELDVAAAADEAVTKATQLLGATQPPSRRLTVVFEPDVTGSFLGILGSTLSGEAVLKGRSLFANRIGEVVGAACISFIDDPTNSSSLGAEIYDGEGLARRRNVLIENGVLQGFLYDTYSARRAGTTTTASASRGYGSTPSVAVRAPVFAAGPLSQAELMAQVSDGFLVQSVSGLHSGVNPVSGDFSVGATGVMIRGGVAAEPVREATIASTLQRMLKDVIAVGADIRWLPGGAAGMSLAIADVSLSGS